VLRAELVSDADDRAIGIALQVRVGGELADELKSPTPVDRGNVGSPPGAIIGDDNEDLVIGEGGVEPDRAWRRLRREGVLDGIGEGFVHGEGEVVGGVIVNEGFDPAAEGPVDPSKPGRGSDYRTCLPKPSSTGCRWRERAGRILLPVLISGERCVCRSCKPESACWRHSGLETGLAATTGPEG